MQRVWGVLLLCCLWLPREGMATLAEHSDSDRLVALLACLEEAPELEQAKAEAEEKRASLGIERSRWWPQLSLNAQWGRSSLPLSQTEQLNLPVRSYSASVEQVVVNFVDQAAIKRQRLTVRRAVEKIRQVETTNKLELIKRYLTLLKSYQDVSFTKFEWSALAEQAKLVRATTQAGLSSSVDLLEAKAREDEAQAAWVQAQETLKQARTAIFALTAHRLGTLFDLPEQFKIPSEFSVPSWLNLEKLLITDNPELRVAQWDVEIKKQLERESRYQAWPTLSLTANASRFKGTFAGTFSNDPTLWAKTIQLGVMFNWPIDLAGAASAGAEGAHFQVLAQHQAHEQLLRERKKELYAAYLLFEGSPSQLKALKQATVSAEAQLKSIRAAFEAGLRTNADVLTHISQWVDAKRNHMNKRYDQIVSWAQIQALIGQLNAEQFEKIEALFSQHLFDVFE